MNLARSERREQRFYTALSLFTVLTAFGIAGQPIALGQAEGRAFQQPPESPRLVDHELGLDLTVGYTYIPIFNPAISANSILRIRTYNGALVGPTIRVQPGDRLTVNLANALLTRPGGSRRRRSSQRNGWTGGHTLLTPNLRSVDITDLKRPLFFCL